jgi:hypothetical protein
MISGWLKLGRWTIRFLNKVGVDTKNVEISEITYNRMINNLCGLLCVLVHIIICGILLHVNPKIFNWIIYSSIVFFVLMFFVIAPTIKIVFDLAIYIIKHESNRNI